MVSVFGDKISASYCDLQIKQATVIAGLKFKGILEEKFHMLHWLASLLQTVRFGRL